jgi:metallopeptidase MepB
VFAADIFDTVFKANPLNAQEGLRYRRMFLEKGGSQDGMELVVNFLGRGPQMKPFYQQIGLE